MTSWLAEYSSALGARDSREQSQRRLIDSYTKLADQVAALVDTSHRTPEPNSAETRTTPAQPAPSSFPFRTKSPSTTTTTDPSLSPNAILTRLRADLSATQRARSNLEAQLPPLQTEIATLRSETTISTRRISELTRQVAQLERRVRDRDEEIKGKAKLVEHAHDELATLEMQLIVAERKNDELQRENGDLVERWMARMGEEAESMNADMGWK